MDTKPVDLDKTKKLLRELLRPEANFFWVVVVYSTVISLLTLSVPIAVQTLINTVANIASTRSVIFLTVILLIALLLYAAFSALRMRVMEYYERRVYGRLASKISMHTLFANPDYFDRQKNTAVTLYTLEIMTVQKNLPILMVDGFALIMQMLVGFTLVAFYHPALLLFNLVVISLVFLIWKLCSNGARRTAIELSNAKYQTAKWVNQIALAHDFFSSPSQLNYAQENTRELIASYLDRHAQHFKYTFTQSLLFLLLFAFASATLMALGGWLVIQGDMSIGQLVAAELIMSAVFFGLSRFGQYLELYYELYGSADKLAKAVSTPQSELSASSVCNCNSSNLTFHDVTLAHEEHHYHLNISLASGSKYYVDTRSNWLQDTLIDVLRGTEQPRAGWVSLGDQALSDFETYALRQHVALVSHSLIIETTIKKFLQLAAPSASVGDICTVLEQVQLMPVINKFEHGIDTEMSLSGSPLHRTELLQLRFAAALLAKPKVILLDNSFDMLDLPLRTALLNRHLHDDCTVLYFSHAKDVADFDGELDLDKQFVMKVSHELS
jgi:ABC-type bacteriocin/lantibiotic exporter with double-glycine peptidase domain